MATSVDSPSTIAPDKLTPVLSSKYALCWQHAAVCLYFAPLFLYLSFIPLPVDGTSHHANWGRRILNLQALPAEDPFLPLAEGISSIDLSSLGQVLIAKAEAIGRAKYEFNPSRTLGLLENIEPQKLQSGTLNCTARTILPPRGSRQYARVTVCAETTQLPLKLLKTYAFDLSGRVSQQKTRRR